MWDSRASRDRTANAAVLLCTASGGSNEATRWMCNEGSGLRESASNELSLRGLRGLRL